MTTGHGALIKQPLDGHKPPLLELVPSALDDVLCEALPVETSAVVDDEDAEPETDSEPELDPPPFSATPTLGPQAASAERNKARRDEAMAA
ncbi:MAG: hypothetical protein KUG77_16640 [Nannocystaceae bacterium]|nr:hypothetical protein [Nannocystaceae bacterium]